MTADALAGLRAECARRLCGAPPNTRCICERDGNDSPCPVWLVAADKCIALIRPAVLREAAGLVLQLRDTDAPINNVDLHLQGIANDGIEACANLLLRLASAAEAERSADEGRGA
jgi:hypothetical protein